MSQCQAESETAESRMDHLIWAVGESNHIKAGCNLGSE